MKFFNKSRKQALLAKKLGNYVVYAIGEIVLVVLGILIAVWINNLNTASTKSNDNKVVANEILLQVKEDISQIENTLKSWEKTEELIDSLYQARNNGQDITGCLECINVAYGLDMPDIDRNIISISDRFYTNGSELENVVKEITNTYKSFFAEADYYENLIFTSISDNILHTRDNYTWYAAFTSKGSCDTDCKNYFNNSADFVNRVAYMEFLIYDTYAYTLYLLKERMKKIVDRLEVQLRED